MVPSARETGSVDATIGLDLLTAVKGPLVRVTADVAYETVAVYETATARGATGIIPPAKTANLSGHGPRRCCMNTLCRWGGVARTPLDPPQEPHYGNEVEGSSHV